LNNYRDGIMNIGKIKEVKEKLISTANLEWQEILDLRSAVQNDFQQKGFLTTATFDKILEWKLDDQKALVDRIQKTSPGSLIKTITRCYHEIDHLQEEFNTRVKVHTLLGIPWVGIGVVSAIMAMHEPQLYGTIDQRSWFVLFNKEKKSFSGGDYLKYLEGIRKLAKEAECDVQEVDFILWNHQV